MLHMQMCRHGSKTSQSRPKLQHNQRLQYLQIPQYHQKAKEITNLIAKKHRINNANVHHKKAEGEIFLKIMAPQSIKN